MIHHRRLAFLAVLVGVMASPVGAAEQSKPTLDDQVRKAIESGRRFLIDKQTENGGWTTALQTPAFVDGSTCLAVLALLKAGEKVEAPTTQRGLAHIRKLEPKDTYVSALQILVFAEAGLNEDQVRIQRNVDALLDARVLREQELQGWGYVKGNRVADLSNTHFALLGLWAGKAAGAKVPDDLWHSLHAHLYRCQDREGGWSYYSGPSSPAKPTLTMTAAGASGLILSGRELGRRDERDEWHDAAALRKAFRWLGTRYDQVEKQGYRFYTLWSLEDLGRVSGRRFIAGHDWFREGCAFLVEKQAEDGSWSIRGAAFDQYPVVSTSLALLFLAQGRTPVLISKLGHENEDRKSYDWNQRPNDAYHLTQYARREVFQKRPVAWQVFDARQSGRDDSKALAAELLQAPLLYRSGTRKLHLTDLEKRMLKEYLDKGGVLLATSLGEEFDADLRALVKELFPEKGQELAPLPANHPVWSAHFKLTPDDFPLEGVQTAGHTPVLYCSKDLASLWEANDQRPGRGQKAFRLGANIAAFATRTKSLTPKGQAVLDRRGK